MSETVIGTAKEIFKTNGHQGSFHVGDANSMTFEDDKFDVIVSIGLLEHFENLENVIDEQFRVLRKDGVLIYYIVPENLENVQKDYNWVNDILKSQSKKIIKKLQRKKTYTGLIPIQSVISNNIKPPDFKIFFHQEFILYQ